MFRHRKSFQKRERLINIKKIDMKRINSFIMGLVALFTMSVVMVSCSADYSDGPMQAPQKIDPTPTPDPTPQPDSLGWKQCIQKYYKVYETADVISVLKGQRNNGEIDSLVLKYRYIYSLAADTTIYLSVAPTSELGFSSAIENTSYSDYSHNEQGDSVCFINYAKPYYLSNGVNLSLTTQRVRGWHMMGGQPVMYSEPTQSVDRMTISSETTEFERNDSIFGLRTNVCSVPLTLGGVSFTASATVKEIWFSRLKETPEPSFDYKVDGLLKLVCGSKVKNNIGWADGIMFEGTNNLYFVIDSYSKDGKLMGREIHTTPKNRVVYNNQVNGIVFDSTTGLYAPALIVSDKEGWSCEGFVDGRSVTCDRSNTHAIDEGIKNFVDKSTSVPSVFFASTPTASVKEWHGKKYITVNWSKYSEDTKLVNRQVTVAEK
jgi:hypothetical protein